MAHVNKPKSAQRSETKNSSATEAKPQFASKISSLEVSNSPRPHQP